jgi:alkanesulfonate monooxygenase SsuD/methylene tetrahydromethanopterin reductase-like flavin-dependent oxidoreductase (luciferase family)
MTIGVLLHIDNPDFDDIEAVAREAEAAGADWLGVADAFWWHDGWLLLARAAAATRRIELGLAVTNPYLRHPFHTVAALASLQALAGPRVFLGLAAGGTEVTLAAGADRRDAGSRIRDLARLTRAVAAGAPLDTVTGRTLGPSLAPPPILVAGRGTGVLRAAGAVADRALLWAVPFSDLDRTTRVIAEGALHREAPGDAPELVWSPIVDHDGSGHAAASIAYAVLNSRADSRRAWGIDDQLTQRITEVAVAEGNAAASALVPAAAVEDFVLDHRDLGRAAGIAGRIGAGSIAVRATDPATVARNVAWARDVLAASIRLTTTSTGASS